MHRGEDNLAPEVKALLRGHKNSEAIVLIHQRFEAELRAWLQRWFPSGDDAEEVGAKVFLRVTRGIATLEAEAQHESGCPVRGWVYSIARNEVYRHLEARGRRRAQPLASTLVEELMAPGPGASTDLRQRDLIEKRRAALERALEELSEEDRALVLMRVTEQLSFRDIALRLSFTGETLREDTLRQRFKRSVARLKERLDAHDLA